MRTIWKVALDTDSPLSVPRGAVFLSMQRQYGALVAWFNVPDHEATEKDYYRVHMIGTGWNMADYKPGLLFIGTIQDAGGALVWHFFLEAIQKSFRE